MLLGVPDLLNGWQSRYERWRKVFFFPSIFLPLMLTMHQEEQNTLLEHSDPLPWDGVVVWVAVLLSCVPFRASLPPVLTQRAVSGGSHCVCCPGSCGIRF